MDYLYGFMQTLVSISGSEYVPNKVEKELMSHEHVYMCDKWD